MSSSTAVQELGVSFAFSSSFIVCPNSKMQCFRVEKPIVVKSSKPVPDRRRRLVVAEAISIPENAALVSCKYKRVP